MAGLHGDRGNLLAVHFFFFPPEAQSIPSTRTSLLQHSFELFPLEFFIIFQLSNRNILEKIY